MLYLRPPRNVCSLNEMVEMWDIKIGKKLETLHVFEGELLQKIKGIIIVCITLQLFVKNIGGMNNHLIQ